MYLIFFTWIKWIELSYYFSVRGLNTSGRNVELSARAFAAMELKLVIIQSSQSQSNFNITEISFFQGTYCDYYNMQQYICHVVCGCFILHTCEEGGAYPKFFLACI